MERKTISIGTAGAITHDGKAERLYPLNNIVFTTIFENEKKSGIAMQELINSILTREGEEPVKEILSMTSEHYLPGESKGRKYGRLDVKVVSESNRIFNVEVQLKPDAMNERGYFYGSRVGMKAFDEGTPYTEMPEVRVICIEDFYVREDSHNIIEPVLLTYGKEPAEKATDIFMMYHIQLPEFRKRYTTLESVKDDIFLTWMYMLDRGYEDEEEMKELSEMTEGMRNFAEQYGIAINDPKFAKLYEEYSDALHEEASRLAFAENTGLKKGREEGRAEGVFESVENLVAQEILDEEAACTALGVSMQDYLKWKATKA